MPRKAKKRGALGPARAASEIAVATILIWLVFDYQDALTPVGFYIGLLLGIWGLARAVTGFVAWMRHDDQAEASD